MTRFFIGLLLGLLLGIGATTAFLVSAGGGDYFVASSSRVRELESSLKTGDQEREWLRKRLGEADETMAKLESRFAGLAARFESISETAGAAGKDAATGKAPSQAAQGPEGVPGQGSAAPPPTAPASASN